MALHLTNNFFCILQDSDGERKGGSDVPSDAETNPAGAAYDQMEHTIDTMEEEKPKKKRRKRRKPNYDEADAEVASIMPREKPVCSIQKRTAVCCEF